MYCVTAGGPAEQYNVICSNVSSQTQQSCYILGLGDVQQLKPSGLSLKLKISRTLSYLWSFRGALNLPNAAQVRTVGAIQRFYKKINHKEQLLPAPPPYSSAAAAAAFEQSLVLSGDWSNASLARARSEEKTLSFSHPATH